MDQTLGIIGDARDVSFKQEGYRLKIARIAVVLMLGAKVENTV